MNILITGVSKGIGQALAAEALAQDHTVFGTSRNTNQIASTTLNHPNFHALQLDWNGQPATLSGVLAHLSEYQIDMLINNAGLLLKSSLVEADTENWMKMYQVNTIFPFEMSRLLYKAKKFARGASIINISSMGGFQGAAKFPGLAGYSMSKAALVALTECMAVEWSAEISVNCLCLGAVQTDMLTEAFPGYKAPVSPQQMAKFVLGFGQNTTGIINGSAIPVKISDPNE